MLRSDGTPEGSVGASTSHTAATLTTESDAIVERLKSAALSRSNSITGENEIMARENRTPEGSTDTSTASRSATIQGCAEEWSV